MDFENKSEGDSVNIKKRNEKYERKQAEIMHKLEKTVSENDSIISS